MAVGDLAFRLDPERVALVIVDVQEDFCGPRTSTGQPRDTSAIEPMLRSLNRLIAEARSAAVPVVYVKTIADATSDSEVWRSRRAEPYPFDAEVCKAGTPGAEYSCDPPRPGDVEVTKRRYDAFVGTELDFILRNLHRSALVMTGTLTDICVETAVRHAVSLDYFVTVASDCCASFTQDAHDRALERIARAFGRVVTAEEVAAHWRGDSSPAALS